jgi:hypothetical protein
MSDIPPYVKSPDQENYNEELNQTLYQAIGPNGFQVSTLTNAQLTVNPVVDPNGNMTTVAALAPNGSVWWISDGAPADLVVKRSGVLRRIQTAAYP